MQIQKLRQVYIVAEDFEAQVKFYGETLGLTLQFRDGNRWAQFQAGGVSLAIASAEEGQGARPNVPVPVFEVDDLGAALGTLTASGHTVGAVRDMGAHGRSAAVHDTAGVQLVLFQRA